MSALRWYLEASALLAVGALCLAVVSRYWPTRSRAWLALSHAALVAALVLPLGATWFPRDRLLKPSVQVWSGAPRARQAPYTLIAPAARAPGIALEGVRLTESGLRAGAWLALAGLLAALGVHASRLWRLRRVLRSHVEIRRLGRVSVRVSESDPVAYSAWLPFGLAYAVLPVELLGDREAWRLALLHELQHHRQRDTLWVHAHELCRAIFFWHPGARAWSRLTERFQELACDEALIGRRDVSAQAYGRCLVRAAQLALSPPLVAHAGTTRMAAGGSGLFLKRRVEMLFETKKAEGWRSSRGVVAAVAVGLAALLATTAFAARGLVQDRTLTLEEARKLVERPGAVAARGAGEIPIQLNDLVLAQLNRYVGTPEGREFVRGSLERMPQYKALIDRKTAEYGAPAELIAVAFTESGFVNDATSTMKARGIWQFVPQTARNYGLRVDGEAGGVDERLDVPKATDAAMRYLRDVHNLFGDWRLALKSYNEGESRVAKLIREHKTRDPWVLERASSTESYLAKVSAMILILRNPQLVD